MFGFQDNFEVLRGNLISTALFYVSIRCKIFENIIISRGFLTVRYIIQRLRWPVLMDIYDVQFNTC